MPRTLNYGRSETTDFKILGALIVGFAVWDLSTLYFGAVALAFGINYTMLTSPEYQKTLEGVISSTEDYISPLTSNQTWQSIRPIMYLVLSMLICINAVFIAF